jgi:hypothetical protein
MPGMPKELIEHCLKVNPKATPKKQGLRCLAPDKREAIKKELAKLLAAGFIKEVYHPAWLANPVLVLKKIIMNGGCVWITLISTDTARRTRSRSHASTKSLTPWLVVSYSLSSIATQATIRFPSRKKIRSR